MTTADGAEREDAPRRLAAVLVAADRHSGQRLRFRDVRRDHERLRSSSDLHRAERLVVEQTVAALGDHHRIDDEQRDLESSTAAATASTMAAFGEHAGLGGVGADVRHHGFDLRGDEIG